MSIPARRLIPQSLEELFVVPRTAGFRLIGPRVRDQAVVFDEFESSQDLLQGWIDEQEKGHIICVVAKMAVQVGVRGLHRE